MKKSNREWCEVDYKHHHYWELLGIYRFDNGEILAVYKCTQCQKCKEEHLSWVEGGEFDVDSIL